MSRTRTINLAPLLGVVVMALCLIMLVQLPPVSERHHCFVKHKWQAYRAYANVANMDPKNKREKLEGQHECVDGSILNIAFDGELWDVVPTGVDPMDGRKFVYTAYTSSNKVHIERIVDRCLGR